MASKKAQPASPFGWVNSMREFSSKIRKGPRKATTTLGAGTGMGMSKYASENYQQTGIKRAVRTASAMTPHSQAVKEAYEYDKTRTDRPKKVAAPKGPTTAQKRAAFSAANAPIESKAIKPSISGMGVAGLSKAAPKAMNVTPSRTYSEKEQKINALLMTGKKKDGTMKASAQRKIQRIRRK
jgi:hypothetical protein